MALDSTLYVLHDHRRIDNRWWTGPIDRQFTAGARAPKQRRPSFGDISRMYENEQENTDEKRFENRLIRNKAQSMRISSTPTCDYVDRREM